jgi:glycosyltransferase involved in cell wall biosynthesis
MLISWYVFLRHGLDVVQAHAPPDMFVIIAAFYKLLGKRFVFDHHDLSPELFQAQSGGNGNRIVDRALRFFERRACRWADQLIATNESQRRVQIERCGVEPSRTNIVRNGPDGNSIHPADPIAEFRQPNRTVIGYMGMIGFQDGLDYLIRALMCLREELGRADFLAIIIGSGPAVPSLKVMSREMGLSEHVVFTGYLTGDSLLRHMSSADVFVTPDPSNPYNDSCTMIKMMEYMAIGKPIVAFDLPEHRVSAADAALYAQPNDERQFAQCIQTLMDSPDLRQAMGNAGRLRVQTLLSWQHQRGNLIETYRKLLWRRAPSLPVATQQLDKLEACRHE